MAEPSSWGLADDDRVVAALELGLGTTADSGERILVTGPCFAVSMYAIQGVGTTVDELRRHIIGGAADLAAFQARWFGWVGEFDELEGWAVDGIATLAAWLGHYCGLDGRTARQHSQVARSLRTLPLVAAAFGEGRLSYSKVRAVCRVGSADNEALLVELPTPRAARG